MSNNNRSMRASLFIPADVLTKLVEGSYESLITRVQQLVETHRASIFGEDSDDLQFRVSATYAQHAIVLSTSELKPVVRVEFSEGAGGVLKLVQHGVVPVPTYDTGSVDDFAKVEARRAVDALFAGDVAGASARLNEAVRHIEPTQACDAAKVLATIAELRSKPVAWRRAVTGSQVAKVRALLGERFEETKRGIPNVRYSGSTATLAEVREALISLDARLESCGRRIQGARQQLEARREAQAADVQTALATFRSVAEDMSRDIRGMRELAKMSARDLDKSEKLAQVYDALADTLFEFEIATVYVASLVERL